LVVEKAGIWTGGILPPDLPSWKLGCGSGTLTLHTILAPIWKLSLY